MRLSKFFIVLVLILRTCLARILIRTLQPDVPVNLVKATTKILTSCYGNRGNAVGLAGNLPGVLLRELWAQQSLPAILIDDNLIADGLVPRKLQRKLESFVVIASSSSDLKDIFTKIKVSVWWNHLASFLILDWNPFSINRGCSSASQLLWTAWKMDVLNAKVLCHSSQEPTIYTFNPYTNQAPDSWQTRTIYTGKNNHPWTLLRRKYDNGWINCGGLDFDKTRDLGGHEIRTSVTELTYCENGKVCLSAFQAVMVQLLYPALNATYKALIHNSYEAAGNFDKNGIPTGMLADVANGISDISLLSRYPMAMTNLTTAYPHWESGIYALTRFNGYMSQLDKFISLMDLNTRLGMYAVGVSAIIFFKYFQRQDLVSAILNLIRLSKSEALLKLPMALASRIYLASLFLFAVIWSGLYQGKMATFLTNSMCLPNVNTMKDLANSEYKIYGNLEYARFFSDPEFDGRFFGSTEQVCTHHVLENKMAACVHEKFLLINEAAAYTLHLSRAAIVRLYWVFQIRENWPLERRVNIVIQRFNEADLIRHLHARRIKKTLRLLEISENRNRDDSFNRLTLNELKFAFIFLLIGQILSAASFLVELGIERFHLRKFKVRTIIQN